MFSLCFKLYGVLTPVPGPLLALHDVAGAEHLPLQQVGAPPRLRDLAPVADVCKEESQGHG